MKKIVSLLTVFSLMLLISSNSISYAQEKAKCKAFKDSTGGVGQQSVFCECASGKKIDCEGTLKVSSFGAKIECWGDDGSVNSNIRCIPDDEGSSE